MIAGLGVHICRGVYVYLEGDGAALDLVHLGGEVLAHTDERTLTQRRCTHSTAQHSTAQHSQRLRADTAQHSQSFSGPSHPQDEEGCCVACRLARVPDPVNQHTFLRPTLD
jgi:hypothetical protein